jgi:hypothetical protein
MPMKVKRLTVAVGVAATLVLGGAIVLPATSDATSRTAADATAKHIWKVALCRAAYQQGGLWRQAARDLDAARPLPKKFRVAAGWLRTISGLPETGDTAAQMRLFARDARQLDHFFHTPGLYVSYTGQCPA